MRRLLVILFTLGGAYAVGRVLRPLLGLRLPYGLWIYVITLGIFVVLGRHLNAILLSREQSKQVSYPTFSVPVYSPQPESDDKTNIAPRELKYCTKCGTPIAADDKFCERCGAPRR